MPVPILPIIMVSIFLPKVGQPKSRIVLCEMDIVRFFSLPVGGPCAREAGEHSPGQA